MTVLIMIAQLILGLMILVGVHEAGHMIAAKFFGMRVEKFSIGFPPKVFSFKIGETEYSLGALPLGGFVKISGMVDESMDTKNLGDEPQPWEFRSKPAWQRLIVMLGGIIVNVIVGVLIFIGLNYTYGKTFLPKEELKFGIHAFPMAESIGLQSGDKIVKINGNDYESFSEIINPDVLLGDNSYYTVKRNDQLIDIKIPSSILDSLSGQQPFISYAFPFKIGKTLPNGNADKAGMLADDVILKVGDEPVPYFHSIQKALLKHKNEKVDFLVQRGDEELTINAQVSEDGKVGFYPLSTYQFKFDTTYYSIGEATSKGTFDAFNVLFIQFKAFKKIFTGEISARKSLSSPIGMAQQFGGTFIAQRFWYLVGLLSMVLAFMNLLPIPALDGGHVMFLTYEIITGKKPSDKFLEVAVKIGISLLLSLMIFAFGNDIIKLFF